MAVVQQGLIIMPAILYGLIIGIYEAAIIHRDVTIPTHRFGHMIHALIFAIIAVFINMNVPFVLSQIPSIKSIPVIGTAIGIQIIVALIMAIKVHGVSKALQGAGMSSAGMGETWAHSLVVAALTIAPSYVHPLIASSLPAWLR